MRYLILIFSVFLVFSLLTPVYAKIDMVTLPGKGEYQLTIYNSADLTLVRDKRDLTFSKGMNRIEFSWANTLIDPTSVLFTVLENREKIEILDTSFPAHVNNTLVWNIKSEISGNIPVEISYFTSGISWKADYFINMDSGEENASFKGFVTVSNNSGEDYEDAQVRLVVGKINLVERIDTLAGRDELREEMKDSEDLDDLVKFEKSFELNEGFDRGVSRAKKIKKESLSEYFIFSVEGRETIKNNWSKRLPSMKIPLLPVKSVFKHEEYRFGNIANRFLTFKNDKKHNMGKSPIPDGKIRVLKKDGKNNLQYLGNSTQKYIPPDGTVEIELGNDREIKVEIKLLDYRLENYSFDYRGNVSGWDVVSTYLVKTENFKSNPVRIEMKRKIYGKYELETETEFEQEDLKTVKFSYSVRENNKNEFKYTVRNFKGNNADGK